MQDKRDRPPDELKLHLVLLAAAGRCKGCAVVVVVAAECWVGIVGTAGEYVNTW